MPTSAGAKYEYVMQGDKYLMRSLPSAGSTAAEEVELAAADFSKYLGTMSESTNGITGAKVIISGTETAITDSGEIAAALKGAAAAASKSETATAAAGEAFIKSLPAATQSQIVSKALSGVLRFGGEIFVIAGVLYTGYDMIQPEVPAVYGIEIVPQEEVAKVCEQLY